MTITFKLERLDGTSADPPSYRTGSTSVEHSLRGKSLVRELPHYEPDEDSRGHHEDGPGRRKRP
jgi:hypothetical protein